VRLLRIASFEIQRRLRMISTYVYFAVFFVLGGFWMVLAAGGIPGATLDFGAGGKVFANAPYSILVLVMLIGFFGTVITAAVAGRATFQDIDHRTTSLFFTAPIRKIDYLGGRYLGALGSMLLVVPGIAVGAWVASHLPFLDATRIGPAVPYAYLAPYVTVLLPNLVLTSALFFALATLGKRMLPVYVGAVVLVLGYLIAGNISGNIENRSLAALLDPFGLNAADRMAEYWTIAEKNTRLVPLTGLLLWNRVLWTGLGAALLGWTYVRFSFSAEARPGGEKTAEALAAEPLAASFASFAPTLDFSSRASFAAFRELTRLQFKETVKNVFFLVIVLAGVLFVIASELQVDQLFGTKTYPVTYEVLSVLGGTFMLFLLIIITFYSGELVWRERDVGLAPIFDALPIERWVVFSSKLLALMLVQVVLLVVLMASCITLQAAKGYFHFELDVYLKTLFGIRLASLWFLCCLAMLVHVLVNNKYVGHFVMILYFIVGIALPLVGFERHIYRLGSLPDAPYSAMNGFGHFVLPMVTFEAFWSVLALAFALVANALWVRGADTAWGKRLALARATLTPATVIALVALAVAFVGVGGFILWNTDHLNHFKSGDAKVTEQADYESKYKKWSAIAQPKIESVRVAVDIFPEDRRVRARGTYAIENESNEDIAQVAITETTKATITKLTFERGEKRSLSDERLGFYVYDLPRPLRPHEKATLDFDLSFVNDGFPESDSNTQVLHNGTFFNSLAFPAIGYTEISELEGDASRHKHGLAPKALPPAGDARGSMRNFVSADSNWIDFDATVSTTEGQLAIAPGYLQREWSEGGRHYFHYAMDSRILGFYAFLSARYTVLRDQWSPPPSAMPGSQPVAIEIDYQAEHTYDLDRMVKGIKRSLDYYTTKFGPYPHHQARIVEFPRYERFAQSFPNTIPFSEAIGFIARVDDSNPDDIDYPFYVTAHEVAHQWWAHQVISGDVEGATMLDESLAQYSALMVMKHEYGPDKMKKFLRYELDRYLHGRSTAKRAEMPLVRVDGEPYIHYGKGSLVMYALQDYIGEDALDAVLAKFIAEKRFQSPPYTDSRELVAAIRAATPPELSYVVEDLFETITLYENRAKRATSKLRADGRYDVQIEVTAKKVRASELGAETEVALHDFIDVGVLGKDGKVLALRREKIDSNEATFTLVVDDKPLKAGIDPLDKLIDRNPDDNVIRVE
jgi:ABC-type transport system involved in multi-copper enzyme maturation permease subunit